MLWQPWHGAHWQTTSEESVCSFHGALCVTSVSVVHQSAHEGGSHMAQPAQ